MSSIELPSSGKPFEIPQTVIMYEVPPGGGTDSHTFTNNTEWNFVITHMDVVESQPGADDSFNVQLGGVFGHHWLWAGGVGSGHTGDFYEPWDGLAVVGAYGPELVFNSNALGFGQFHLHVAGYFSLYNPPFTFDA